MAWCLPQKEVEKFKRAILFRRIDPERLAEMSSAERRALFAKELGEVNAEPINAEFESKLLLKNRQQGYITWARKMLGENTPAGRDVISRIQRMDKILDAKEEAEFLNDLASKKLGVEVNFEEAKQIAELSKRIDETKAAMDAGGDRLDYGMSLVNMRRYVGELKTQAERMSVEEFKRRPFVSVAKTVWEGAKLSKALKAAWDNSSIYRPGGKVMMTSPKIWAARAGQSFKRIVDTYGKKEVLDMADADILSRENALNGYYKKSGLDIGVREEAYPTDLPERAMMAAGERIEKTGIPIVSKVLGRAVGRTYKASQDVYTATTQLWRADLFDKYINIAKKTGIELDDIQLKAIGRMVNSLVGRGRLGSLEKAGEATNIAFFSPKMLKSHIDVLLEPVSGGGGGFTTFSTKEPGTNFVRKQAALNLLKIVGGTAAILATAKALKPDSVEEDPRSANFGKIRVGDTRFDVTGGSSSLAILAARLLSGKTKSSLTGEIREINERDDEGKLKFGAQTRKDLVYDFFENKLAPAAAVASDVFLEGETHNRETPTVWTSLRDLYVPFPVTNYAELKNNPNSAPLLLALIMDGLGIAANTYSPTPKQKEQMEQEKRRPESKRKSGRSKSTRPSRASLLPALAPKRRDALMLV